MLLFIRMKPNLKYIVMKTESHHITEKKIESGDKHHNLGMDSHSLYILWLSGGIVNVEKIYCDYFSCDFFFLWLFFLWFFSYLSCDFLSCDFFSVYHLCIVYIISHLLEEMYENQISILLKFHVLPWKTIICISDLW
jgi:hypothetical protein